MVEPENVGEEAGHATLEGVELGERVVADPEQHVHAERRARQDLGQRLAQRATAVAAVVDEVLLHLVEHEVDLAAHLRRPLGEDVREPELVAGRLGSGRGRDRDQRVVSPLIDHDRQRAVALTRAAAHRHERAQPPHHARAEERALADAARPVENGQPGGDEIGGDELGLAVAPEEEALVELGVVEPREPLVRSVRNARAAVHTAASRAESSAVTRASCSE
jgi:hypothetical protein